MAVEAREPGLLCETDATASGSGWATWTSSALASCLTWKEQSLVPQFLGKIYK